MRGWFLIIGLMVCLLLVGSAYFLLSSQKSISGVPSSPTGVTKPSVSNTSSESGFAAPTADTAPSPQPQSSSAPAPAYQYNARGQLQAIIYPDGSTYTYAYDAYGDKIRETNTTGKTWTYVYDQNHNPISVIDPEGRVTHKEAPPGESNAK